METLTQCNPKISIIIPCFNAERYIGACLESIRQQNYSPLEVIVVDGASRDRSLEVAGQYRDIVTTIISEPDRGQADAVNKGLRIATGDVHHWHAADDIVMKGALQAVSNAFRNDAELGMVISDGLAFDDSFLKLNYTARCIAASFRSSWLFFDRFQSDCTYWRAEATQRCLPLRLEYPVTVDEEFFLRVWEQSRQHKWISQPLGSFRVRVGQISGSYNPEEVAQQRRLFRVWVSQRKNMRARTILLQRAVQAPVYVFQRLTRGLYKIINKSLDILIPARRRSKLDWIVRCHTSTSTADLDLRVPHPDLAIFPHP